MISLKDVVARQCERIIELTDQSIEERGEEFLKELAAADKNLGTLYHRGNPRYVSPSMGCAYGLRYHLPHVIEVATAVASALSKIANPPEFDHILDLNSGTLAGAIGAWASLPPSTTRRCSCVEMSKEMHSFGLKLFQEAGTSPYWSQVYLKQYEDPLSAFADGPLPGQALIIASHPFRYPYENDDRVALVKEWSQSIVRVANHERALMVVSAIDPLKEVSFSKARFLDEVSSLLEADDWTMLVDRSPLTTLGHEPLLERLNQYRKELETQCERIGNRRSWSPAYLHSQTKFVIATKGLS